MTGAELSRTVRVDTLGSAPRTIEIDADEKERDALARRFGFLSIARLSAEMILARKNEAVAARGTVRAELAQSCVATGEPVPETVEEPFELEFRPHPGSGVSDEEIELGEGEMDVVFYAGALIDIGGAVADTLSLAVQPYPRTPGAADALRQAGVRSEEEAGPFGALAALRDKLKK